MFMVTMKSFAFIYLFCASSIAGQEVMSKYFDPQSQPPGVFDILQVVNEVFRRLFMVYYDVLLDFKQVHDFSQVIDEAVKRFLGPPKPVPKLPQNVWWGEDEMTKLNMDTSVRPFKIRFSDEMIKDLRYRLYNRRNITKPIKNSYHTMGIHSAFLGQFLDYWAKEYDFKAREKYLNRHPQYITNIQGLDIHFIHIKANSNKKVLPLLILHGMPNTAMEYNYVIEKLLTITAQNTSYFEFEMVVPDLPGYGYSQATTKKGLSSAQVAIIFKNLMRRLGHEKFFIHAGDVGEFVGNAMATLYQNHILGFHTNTPYSVRTQTLVKYVLGQIYPPAVVENQYENRMYPLRNYLKYVLENSGYYHIHATKPETIGVGLEDSPAGLAAWILPLYILSEKGSSEKFKSLDGRQYQHYTIDDVADTLTVYWDSHCMTTGARFYYENSHDPAVFSIRGTPTQVPYAAIKFKGEIVYSPDSFLRDKYPNLVQSTTLNHGGHFAPYEDPGDIADSIWSAIPKMETFNKLKKNNKN